MQGVLLCMFFLFFKQKTAYDLRISDWSSDVCSSDLARRDARRARHGRDHARAADHGDAVRRLPRGLPRSDRAAAARRRDLRRNPHHLGYLPAMLPVDLRRRSEEHTSGLQSLMRTSYAVFCLKKKNKVLNDKHIYIEI